jgi:Retrotransposon gag protein
MNNNIPMKAASQEEAISHLYMMVEDLKKTNIGLRAELERNKELNNQKPPKESKPVLPERFDGKPKNLHRFMNQMELAFRLAPSRFELDSTKIATIGTLLTDVALDWFSRFLETPLDESSQLMLNDYDAFKQSFENRFGDPNEVYHAETIILKIKQGSRSVSGYSTEFQVTAQKTNWDDASLLRHYRRGLNQPIKNQMLSMPRPRDLEECIRFSIDAELRLNEIAQESIESNSDYVRRFQKPYRNVLPPSTSFPRNHTPIRNDYYRQTPPQNMRPHQIPISRSDPMEIDASQLGGLPRSERNRRRSLGLCGYCGNPEHHISSCPIKPPLPPHRNRINSYSSPSQSENVSSQ